MLAKLNEIEKVFWFGNGTVAVIALLMGLVQIASGYAATGLLMLCIPFVVLFNVCMWFVKDHQMIRRKVFPFI